MYHIPTDKRTAARRRLILKLGFALILIVGVLWEYSRSPNLILLVIVAMIVLYAIKDLRAALAPKGASLRHDLQRAIQQARLQAEQRRAPAVTTDDLVLGILEVEDSPVSAMLRTSGVTASRMRDLLATQPTLEQEVQQPPEEFSSAASQALSSARSIAILHNHDAIGTEHLLLAMTQADRRIVQLFSLLGVPEERLGQLLLQVLDE